jgi:hypothetical protein
LFFCFLAPTHSVLKFLCYSYVVQANTRSTIE